MAAHALLPVLGVPMKSEALNGLDSLLSTVQMPGGIPVGALAIGKAGAVNAALLAIAILANSRPELRTKLRAFQCRTGKESSRGGAGLIGPGLQPQSGCDTSSPGLQRRATLGLWEG